MLTLRHFCKSSDPALARTMPFHDALARRGDIRYFLHVIGQVPNRTYARGPEFWQKRQPDEVWVVKSWDHPLITAAALVARARRIPLVMWGERPGFTYEARSWIDWFKIRARDVALPLLFWPYREPTLLLGTGSMAVDGFRQLTRNLNSRVFIYPNAFADECLDLPPPPPVEPVPLLLYVGSFTRRKGIDLLDEALQQVTATFRMRYVGEGDLSPSSGEVCPFVKGQLLLNHYQAASGVVLASRHDGWGLTVHEGLARGVPVLVSDACGAVDLVEASGCGEIFAANSLAALAQAIQWWADLSQARRIQLGQQGRSLAKKLTVKKLAREFIRQCEQLVS